MRNCHLKRYLCGSGRKPFPQNLLFYTCSWSVWAVVFNQRNALSFSGRAEHRNYPLQIRQLHRLFLIHSELSRNYCLFKTKILTIYVGFTFERRQDTTSICIYFWRPITIIITVQNDYSLSGCLVLGFESGWDVWRLVELVETSEAWLNSQTGCKLQPG